jgi:DNA-binding MarR family transcriptional regulator
MNMISRQAQWGLDLLMLQKAALRAMAEGWTGEGVTPTRMLVLSALARHDGRAPGVRDLEEWTGIDRSTTSTTARQLGKLKLVKFGAVPTDYRRMAVKLTKDGEDWLEKALPLFEAAQGEFWGKIGGANSVAAREYVRLLKLLSASDDGNS